MALVCIETLNTAARILMAKADFETNPLLRKALMDCANVFLEESDHLLDGYADSYAADQNAAEGMEYGK